MKKIYKIILTLFASVLVFYACTDGFESINTNPNKTTIAEPEYLFGLSPVYTLRQMGSNSNWFFFGNYTNQMSVVGGGGPHFGKDGRSDNLWQNLYVRSLNPLVRIIQDYGDNSSYANRVAIARIWKAYVFSQMVAMWGPLPYTEACNEGPYMKYDSEEFIYRDILKELKDAYTTLESGEGTDSYPAEAEPFLQSDISRWSKYAHCIRLRVAMRLAEVEESWAPGLAAEARQIVAEELNNAEKGLLIADNTGNFFMNWGEEEQNQNPFYREITSDPQHGINDPGNYPVIHESLIMWTQPKTYNDPCLASYMRKGDGEAGTSREPSPEYFGRPYANGTPQGYQWPTGVTNPYDKTIYYYSFSTVHSTFAGRTAQFPFFTYPEIAGYRAEASYKGWWSSSKSTEDLYYDLIQARCSRFSAKAADVTRYMSTPGIQWGTESDTLTRVDPDNPRELLVDGAQFRDFLGIINSYLGVDDNYKRIILQQWLNFFYQGVDSWTLLRRTQVLEFKPHWNTDTSTAYVSDYYAYTPNRLKYPSAEIDRNADEVKNAINNLLLDNKLKDPEDQITFRLIFCKDYDGLKNVPMNGSLVNFPNTARNRVK